MGTVALFAEVEPPKFAPTTVTVSLTLKPVPAAFIATVYVPFVFVILNVALAPAREELPVTAVKVLALSKVNAVPEETAPFTTAVAVFVSRATAVVDEVAPFTVEVAVCLSVTVADSTLRAAITLALDTTLMPKVSPVPGIVKSVNLVKPFIFL